MASNSLDASIADTSEVPIVIEESDAPSRRRFAGVARIVDASSTVPIYVGVAVALAGFVLFAVTWGQVAALTNVALQLPYIASGGLTGLALVMVGMTIVNVQSRRRDGAERSRQMERLAGLLGEVGSTVSGDGAGRKPRSKRGTRR